MIPELAIIIGVLEHQPQRLFTVFRPKPRSTLARGVPSETIGSRRCGVIVVHGSLPLFTVFVSHFITVVVSIH